MTIAVYKMKFPALKLQVRHEISGRSVFHPIPNMINLDTAQPVKLRDVPSRG
jgi:hypothetical protein